MKPCKLEFQAFGPYAGYECIDFDDLSRKGLFLICGETGSGKTMILDAMTFALYGKSSGHGRDDFAAMRCSSAADETATFVKLIFRIHTDYYMFERRLEKKRKNYSASYNLQKLGDDGMYHVLLENPKEKELNAKAVELIGLDYDQFRQVIMLPQGQFERLLTSNSDEKEKILTSIFGEDKWQSIADKMYDACLLRNNALKAKRDRIVNSLAEEGCNSISELEVLLGNKDEELKKLNSEYEIAEFDKRLNGLQEKIALSRVFDDLNKALKDREGLLLLADKRKQDEVKLSMANKAEGVRSYINNRNIAADSYSKRKEAISSLEIAVDKANEAGVKATADLAQHMLGQQDIEKLVNRKNIYESKLNDYIAISADEQEYNSRCARLDALKKDAEAKKANVDAVTADVVTLTEERNLIISEYTRLSNLYIIGIAGVLAEGLMDGDKCPVCGSTHHPEKAVRGVESVTKTEVDAKRTKMDEKESELSAKTALLTDAQSSQRKTDGEVAEATVECEKAKGILESKRSNLIEGISSAEALKAEIEGFEATVKKYKDQKTVLEAEEKSAKEQLIKCNADLASAKDELKKAEDTLADANATLDEVIINTGFKDEAEATGYMLDSNGIQLLQTSIAEYDANLKSSEERISELKKSLEGKDEPDGEKIREEQETIHREQEVLIQQRAAISTELMRLNKKLTELNNEGNGIEQEIAEAENDLGFAKKLRGDTGTSLQRYVLGIMFSTVVSAANRMLEQVHDGRYRLYRSDEKAQGTNKRGLELKVYDKYSDGSDGRFVNTLSGGEKFLVSLALSIGLSTIAQKSGMEIEALFIDEGFGSLDENSIVDAMNILNNIQEANGLVGIISHVQILQERISTKLIVSKEAGRSSIRKSIG